KSKGPTPLPAAERRFFAPRLFPLEHEDPVRMAATAPDIMAKVLRDANCPSPFSFTSTVNAKGAINMLCTDLYTPATAYSPYYEAMANKLNQAFPMGDNHHRPFRPPPNRVDPAIHHLPRRVERAHSSSRSSQCRNCNRFGRSAPACKAYHPACPLCANSHPRRAHRCPNPTCPKMGNIKSVPNCCPASLLRCSNCDGL